MRIAIDAREMEKEATGIGRYIAQILRSWDRSVFEQNEIFLYFKSGVPDDPFVCEMPFQKKVIGLPFLRADLLWEQLALPYHLKKDRIDVFWGAGGAVSGIRLGWKNIVNMYDLTFFMDRTWFSWKERTARRFRAHVSAGAADLFLALSKSAKEDCERWLGVSSKKIRLVPAGADHVKDSAPARSGTRPFGARVLFVGSILNRRPVENLIRAAAHLSARFPSLALTIIGENRTRPRKDLRTLAAGLGLEARVFLRGYVNETALQTAYEEADVFCFPSLYEGFGIPILEAQRHGLPVLTLKNSSIEEVGGDSVHYAGSETPADLADGLETLLTDGGYRDTLSRKGRENSKKFRWSAAGRSVLDLVMEEKEPCA